MCTRPLAGIPDGKTANGKTKYKIVSYSRAFGTNVPDQEVMPLPYNRNKMIEIPCGKCQECRLAYAKQWSDRCMLELQNHKSSFFLTLTYDDSHLPTNSKGYPTLRKEHFQLFMKRLRKAISTKYLKIYDGQNIPNPHYHPNGVRYYMCGEYGTHTKRSHYHAIIFGLELIDLKVYGKTDLGDVIYTSEWIDSLWSKGNVIIGSVTPQSCAYVARYVTKKQGNGKKDYEKLQIVPEYTNMSLKPGIGKSNYTPEIFEKGYMCVGTETGGLRIYPPRYYEKLYEQENPEGLKKIKNERKIRMENRAVQFDNQSSKNYLDHHEDKEICLAARTSSLIRQL